MVDQTVGCWKLRISLSGIYRTLLISFILIIYLEPVVFNYMGIHRYFRILQIAGVLIGSAYAFIKRKSLLFASLVCLFFGWLFLSTYIQKGTYSKVLILFIQCYGLIICLQYWIEDYTEQVYKILYAYLFMLVFINWISVSLFETGLIQVSTYANKYVAYYFLGVTNQMGAYILFASCMSIIYCLIKEKICFSAIILNLCGYFTLLQVWSATSLLGMTFMLISLLVLSQRKILKKIFTPIKNILYILCVHYLIVILSSGAAFSYLIVNILKKDLTFSGRRTIWEYALLQIKESPFWGYGEIQNARYITVGTAKFNAHNIFLQISLEGGIILFLIMLGIILFCFWEVKQCKNEKIGIILTELGIILFVMMVAEVYSFFIIFSTLFFIYSSKYMKSLNRNS